MCWQLFLGSDKELPQVEWNEAAPAFNTHELDEAQKRVRAQFSLPHVIHLGAHQGCSCGFFVSDGEETGDESNRETVNEALSQYLESALREGIHLQMFLCWQGGELDPPVEKKYVRPEDFFAIEFPLQENEFATVV